MLPDGSSEILQTRDSMVVARCHRTALQRHPDPKQRCFVGLSLLVCRDTETPCPLFPPPTGACWRKRHSTVTQKVERPSKNCVAVTGARFINSFAPAESPKPKPRT